MLYENILDVVGNTPLVRLNKITRDLKCKVYAKLEFLNPGGSVKDRIGITMVEEAEKHGKLKPGGTIIECTSGNTGMGLAIAACVKGYKTIFTLTDKQSREKISMLKALGAEVIVCPTAVSPDDPRQYVQVAKKLNSEIKDSFLANQYDNPDNPLAHYLRTGPEIWKDTEGKITHLITTMGTCGTIIGTAKYLKEQNSKIKIVGVDPVGSIFYDYFHTGKVPQSSVYKVEGIGEDFFPKVLEAWDGWKLINDMVQATDKESFISARKLARMEGIFAGGSSGSAIAGVLKYAKNLTENDFVVTILPDSGMRYLGKIYNDEWMKENQYTEAEVKITSMDILKNKTIGKLVSVNPGASALSALKMMREKDISQLPVIENGNIVGTIYEDNLISLILQGKDLNSIVIREIMSSSLPIVKKEATVDEITQFVPSKFPAILVDLGDGNYSIITKYDIVHTISQIAEEKI